MLSLDVTRLTRRFPKEVRARHDVHMLPSRTRINLLAQRLLERIGIARRSEQLCCLEEDRAFLRRRDSFPGRLESGDAIDGIVAVLLAGGRTFPDSLPGVPTSFLTVSASLCRVQNRLWKTYGLMTSKREEVPLRSSPATKRLAPPLKSISLDFDGCVVTDGQRRIRARAV